MTDQSKPRWLPDVYDPAEFSHDKQGFRWRCNGAPGCEGWVGLGLGSEDAARCEYDRHVSEEHPARTTPDNPPTSGDAADNPAVAEPDDPSAYALARHIADHPMSTVQAAFRYLNAPLTIELHETDTPPAVAAPATADDGLREQIAAALDAADYRQDMRRGDLADAILPVVNRRMEQLAAGRRLMGARIDSLTARAEAAEAKLAAIRRWAQAFGPTGVLDILDRKAADRG